VPSASCRLSAFFTVARACSKLAAACQPIVRRASGWRKARCSNGIPGAGEPASELGGGMLTCGAGMTELTCYLRSMYRMVHVS